MRVYFATSNATKVSEARALLHLDVHGVDLALQELQSLDVADVVRHKLSQVVELCDESPVLVEDTGLSVGHWSGYPGALIRWVVEALGLERFAGDALRGMDNAAATATSCVGVAYRGEVAMWTGCIRGRIVPPRGLLGGWTPVFQADGSTETLAEMEEAARLQITMRAAPLRAAEQWLADRHATTTGRLPSDA